MSDSDFKFPRWVPLCCHRTSPTCMLPRCLEPCKGGRCDGCNCAGYCSKEHQREDWSEHKLECAELKARKSALPRRQGPENVARFGPGDSCEICLDCRAVRWRCFECGKKRLRDARAPQGWVWCNRCRVHLEVEDWPYEAFEQFTGLLAAMDIVGDVWEQAAAREAEEESELELGDSQ